MRIDWLIISTKSVSISTGSLRVGGLAVNRVALKEGGSNLPFFGAFRVSLDPGDQKPTEAHVLVLDPDGRVSGGLKMSASRSDVASGVYDYVGHGVVGVESPGGYSFAPYLNGELIVGSPQWVVRIDDARLRIDGVPIEEPYPVAVLKLISYVIAEGQHLKMTSAERVAFMGRYGNYMTEDQRDHFKSLDQ